MLGHPDGTREDPAEQLGFSAGPVALGKLGALPAGGGEVGPEDGV